MAVTKTGHTGGVSAQPAARKATKKTTAKVGQKKHRKAEPQVRIGSRGAAVRVLQRALNKRGAHLSVDGDFGPLTDKAVKAFQAQQGLAVDGIVGRQTWRALGYRLGSSGGAGSAGGAPSAGTKTVTGYSNGHPVTIQVAPTDNGQYMQPKAAAAFKKMVAAAHAAGFNLYSVSGFRTYAQQVALYNKYGYPRAAHPGYSNHQMGLAMDIGGIGGYGTSAYKWLTANAGKYGFVNDVGGEYWHFDYKG